MASIQLRVRAEPLPAPVVALAIPDKVSPRLTRCVPPAFPAPAAGDGEPSAGAGVAAAIGAGCVSADAGVLGAARSIAPSRVAAPVAGALTGALATADCAGAYTGGSRSMVYSRTRRPRDQFTSTSKVTKGSEIGSVDLSRMICRPSVARSVRTCT